MYILGFSWNRTLIISDSICRYLPDMRNVVSEAYGGLKSATLLEKLRNKFISVGSYANIIIHVGTNDVNNITKGHFERNMKHAVQEIQKYNPSALILLSSVLPRVVDYNSSDSIVNSFNEVLNEIANVHSNVRYIKSRNSFFNRFGFPIRCLYSYDKLHLSVNGLVKLEKFFANTLAHINKA